VRAKKAGSVLLLRFFRGYYPSEVAQILRTPRQTIDNWVQIARREAKAYLNDPDGLTFMADKQPIEGMPSASTTGIDPFEEMSALILRSRTGDCYSRDQLRELYRDADANAIDSQTLAHLASCSNCLDEVNALLGLPPLSERSLQNVLGRDQRARSKRDHDRGTGGGPGGPTGGAAAQDFVRDGRKRSREAFEHRPEQLLFAANGFLLSSIKVDHERTEQTLNINLDEQINFVEVFSEQGVRLLLMSVEPPPEGVGEQASEVALSDGRKLALALSFSNHWPALRSVYVDPLLSESMVAATETQLGTQASGLPSSTDEQARGLRTHEWPATLRPTQLIKLLRDGSFWLGPATVTALVALILVAALWLVYRSARPPRILAADLLQRAAASEDAVLARTDQVIHRTINLEESVPGAVATGSAPRVLSRRGIEIWQSPQLGITARRLYDERGQLIAGDWRRADGVQTLYNHGKRPQIQIRNRQSAIRTLDNVWQLDIAADEFSRMIGSTDQARVEERANAYVITYEGKNSAPSAVNPSVESATLILNRSDLHAMEMTLVLVGQPTPDTQHPTPVEFHFVETSFERRAPNAVAPAVFDPEVELLGSSTKTKERESLTPGPQPLAPVTATAATEVEVLKLLSAAGADMGEQVTVTRTPEGRLRVDGLVETAERKAELVRALQSVRNNPAVEIRISTVSEALRKQKPAAKSESSEVSVQSATVGDSIPAASELRRYFAGKSQSQDEIEQNISRFANRVTGLSYGTVQRAMALKRLAGRFSPEELRTMDAGTRDEWVALIRSHARTLQQQIAALNQELKPVFPSASGSGGEDANIQSDADLIAVADRLFAVCSNYDESIHRALTVSPDASGAAAIKSPQFWRALQSAEKLSQKISQYR